MEEAFSWEKVNSLLSSVPAGWPVELTVVEICGSPNEDDTSTAFASPILPGTKILESAWAEIKLTPRPLISWQTLFQALLEQEERLCEDPIAKAVCFEDSKVAVKFAYTPRKRPSLPTQGAGTPLIPVKLASVDKDLGDKPSPAVAKMVAGGLWHSLISNVETIHENVTHLSEYQKAVSRDRGQSGRD